MYDVIHDGEEFEENNFDLFDSFEDPYTLLAILILAVITTLFIAWLDSAGNSKNYKGDPPKGPSGIKGY